MTLLLDTQVALWWLAASPKLERETRTMMSRSTCLVSVASIWEVAIKHRIGKLAVTPSRFRDEIRETGATILPISDDHVVTRSSLPESHADPFDRLLVAVAELEGAVLLTSDGDLRDYAKADPRLPIRAV